MADELVTILIKAPLTREELQEVLQKVREIEQRDPSRVFVIAADAPGLSVEEGGRVLNGLEPPIPYLRYEIKKEWGR
ncbi:MAG: hypothetical protein Q8O40_11340 [Chloroflexota bacterium]|nr:hypothetical protein [Chloroflexota bacterium]